MGLGGFLFSKNHRDRFTSDLPPMTLTISSQGSSYFIYFSYKNLARMENSLYLCPKYLNIDIRHILNI